MKKDIRSYITTLPDDRRMIIMKLHDLIVGMYPDATVDMSYKMPTYKAGDGWVALANQKHYVSLYTCAAQHIAEFKESYPDIKTGKGCINFRTADPVPLAAIRKVVKHAMQHSKPTK